MEYFKQLWEEVGCTKPKECRITQTPASTTLMYFPPVYDGYGNNMNPDRNTTSWSESCSTCGKTWRCSSRLGETTRDLILPDKE